MSYTQHTWVNGETVTADKLNHMEDGIADNEAAILNIAEAFAEPFATNKAYTKGDYVLYDGDLYVFTANHSAGAWTGTDVDEAVLANDVSDLKNDLNNLSLFENSNQETFNASTEKTASEMISDLSIPYGSKVFIKIETVSGGPIPSGKSIQFRANNKYITAYTDNDINQWHEITLTGNLNTGETITKLGLYANASALSTTTVFKLQLASWLKKDDADFVNSLEVFKGYSIGADNLLTGVSWTDNYYINASGVVTANNLFRYSDEIEVESNSFYKLIVDSFKQYENTNTRILGYDSSHNFVRALATYRNNNTTERLTFEFNTSGSIKYIRISLHKPPVIQPVYIGFEKSVSDRIDLTENAIKMINNIAWQNGRWSASNGGYESTDTRVCTTDFIPDDVESIAAINDPTVLMWVGAWNSDNVYAGVWTGKRLERTTTYDSQTFIDISYIKTLYPGHKFKITAKHSDGSTTPNPKNIYLFKTGILNDSKPEYIDYDRVVRSVQRIADGLPVPHQSLLGYKYAFRLGFRNLLCDLRFSSDNVPICVHDDYMNHYYSDVYDSEGVLVPTTPPVYFSSLTYSQLQEYDFGLYLGDQFAGTKILTLEQMLDLCKKMGATVYIEMKVEPSSTQFDIVFQLIRDYGMEQNVVWAPTSLALLTALTTYESDVYIQWHAGMSGVYTDVPDSYIDAIINATNDYNRNRVTMILPGTVAISEAQVSRLSAAGVGISTGEVVNTAYIDSYIARGKQYNCIVEALTNTINVGKYLYDSVMSV